MTIYAFKRRQCLHLHVEDKNVFSLYAFKRRQCLHLHFKDDNVFSHLRFQKATMPSFTFQQTTMSSFIYDFIDDNVFISKTSMSFVLVCASYDLTSSVSMLKKKKRTSMSSCVLGLTSLIFASCSIE